MGTRLGIEWIIRLGRGSSENSARGAEQGGWRPRAKPEGKSAAMYTLIFPVSNVHRTVIWDGEDR